MKLSKLRSAGAVVMMLSMLFLAGSAMAGGGWEGGGILGGRVDLATGEFTGPEAWAVVVLQCAADDPAVDITIRAKQLDNCTVKTFTGVFESQWNTGESCPTDTNQLMNTLLYYSFPGLDLIEGISYPVVTKIKNASVKIDSSGITTISFDAQIKNFEPTLTQN